MPQSIHTQDFDPQSSQSPSASSDLPLSPSDPLLPSPHSHSSSPIPTGPYSIYPASLSQSNNIHHSTNYSNHPSASTHQPSPPLFPFHHQSISQTQLTSIRSQLSDPAMAPESAQFSSPTRVDDRSNSVSPVSNLFSAYSPPATLSLDQVSYPFPYPHSNFNSADHLDQSETVFDQPPGPLFADFNPRLKANYSHPPPQSPQPFDPLSKPQPASDRHLNSSSFEKDSQDVVDETEEVQKPSGVKTSSTPRKKAGGGRGALWKMLGRRRLATISLAGLFLIVAAIVIVVVVHARRGHGEEAEGNHDIVAKSGLGSATTNASDFADPFNRAAPASVAPDSGRRGGSDGYDSLVVFGASYCDSAHSRPANLRHSLKPAPYFKGRWTNGYVWNEYLSALIGPGGSRTTLVNYAYGGATVDNSLNEAPVPDLDQQVNAFLSDLAADSPGAGPSNGKSLIAIWIGINSVTKIWNSVLKQEARARSQLDVQQTVAQAQVNINSTVDQIFNVVTSLMHTAAFKAGPADLMILTIPPVELLLVNVRAAKDSPGSLRTLGTLGEMFNNRFVTQFNALQAALSASGSNQRLFTLDVPSIWRKFIYQPASANLSTVDQPCLTKLGVCNDPDSYLFWDTLHPTTHIHKQLALMMRDEISR